MCQQLKDIRQELQHQVCYSSIINHETGNPKGSVAATLETVGLEQYSRGIVSRMQVAVVGWWQGAVETTRGISEGQGGEWRHVE